MMDVRLSRASTSATLWIVTGTIVFTGSLSSCEFDLIVTASKVIEAIKLLWLKE